MNVTACRLRPYQPDDAAALWEAARESVAEVFPWLAWCHAQYSMTEAAHWIHSRSQLAAEGHEYTFAIVGDDGRFLGGCGINQINRIHKFGNLGGIGSGPRHLVVEWRARRFDRPRPLRFRTLIWCVLKSSARWATSEVSEWPAARVPCVKACSGVAFFSMANPSMP